MKSTLLFISFLWLISATAPAKKTTVLSLEEYASAEAGSSAGDTIVWASGSYRDIIWVIQKTGLTILSEQPGKVIFSGKSQVNIQGDQVTFSGFQYVGGRVEGDVVKISGNHITVTQINVSDYHSGYYLNIVPGVQYNRVTYCNFERKPEDRMTSVVQIQVHEKIAGYHLVSHCSFRDFTAPPGAGGDYGIEALRIGYSFQSKFISRTIVEYCWFSRCNGDGEVISSKARENIYRYNTFTDNGESHLTLRHGSDNVVYGNFFLNGAGIRIKEGQNQMVYNNYFRTGNHWALRLENYRADPLDNIVVVHNTFEESGPVLLGGKGDFPPSNVRLSENLFVRPVSDLTGDQTGKEVISGNILVNNEKSNYPEGFTRSKTAVLPNGAGIGQPVASIRTKKAKPAILLDIPELNDDPGLHSDIAGNERPAGRKSAGCYEPAKDSKEIVPYATEENTGPDYLKGTAEVTRKEPLPPLELWYDTPAKIWEEALPLGNGMTGAMVYGGINNEHFALNDHTLWSGFPNPGNKEKGPDILPKVREAIFAGNYEQAATWWKGMHGPYSARYLPLGDLLLTFDLSDSAVSGYTRRLNLRNALSTVSFEKDGVKFTRESFVSGADKVLAIRLTASDKGKISFKALLESKLRYKVQSVEPGYLILAGKAPKHVAHRTEEPQQIIYEEEGGEGMTFEIHLRVIPRGGKLVADARSTGVTGADEVVILLSEATSFNGFDKSPGYQGKNAGEAAGKIMNQASEKSWNELLSRHTGDYTALFDRVELDLGEQITDLPTDERMLRQNKGETDNGLFSLYFQYGRYLMIASSRPGTPPSNLQGIWNQLVQPPWGSNYTININTQMNYWPSEVTRLPECHLPLFDFMKQLAINGNETARTNYGIEKGWLAHHNSDIWAKTSPTGGEAWDPRGAPRWSAWPMGGAWFCRHLWEHYLYSGDRQFLEKEAWPLMKGAAEFLLSWLVEDKNGHLVTNPATSPENVFKINGKSYEVSMASTMDMSIIRELFANLLEAEAILKTGDPVIADIRAALPRLYPFHIGKYGQLQEWYLDWDDPKDSHRHISHLFSLYPGSQITPAFTPELAAAAQQTLIHRGDISTGWSMAWKVNWWARLKDGNHALKILKEGLTYIGSKTEVMGGGGTYANLFCAHPPFQIDGNFGGTAGIAEMLLQSHEGYVELLPALPDEWPSGRVTGLASRGGFIIDMEWKDGNIISAIVYSALGGTFRLKSSATPGCAEASLSLSDAESRNPLLNRPATVAFVSVKPDPAKMPQKGAARVYEWETVAGKEYHLTFKPN